MCIVVVCGELKSHCGEAAAMESGGIFNIFSMKSHLDFNALSGFLLLNNYLI